MALLEFCWIQAILFLLLMLNSHGIPIHVFTTQVYHFIYLDEYGVTFDPNFPNISFSVKLTNNAHLKLSKTKAETTFDAYEVVIGGWSNRRSAIRSCVGCTPKAEYKAKFLNGTEFRSFWVAWPSDYTGTNISVGHGVVPFKDTFLDWFDPDGHVINYIGISSGWSANGTWVFGHVDGGWSEWGNWSQCSTTCGPGVKRRYRICDNPVPEYGGAECPGSYEDEDECTIAFCAIDGEWSTWNTWTDCSFTCGGGLQERTRTCSDPVPQYGGNDCAILGEGSREDMTCNDNLCPVHGSWSSWEAWTSCSETCGQGTLTRARQCDNPPPSHHGEQCEGIKMEEATCNEVSCPINGNWSSWSEWSACSETCGYGNRTHFRSCDNPAPAYGGLPCDDDAEEIEECFLEPCPVNGGWSEWSNMTECSETCGSATKFHFRSCDNPSPMHGGLNCSGPENETLSCDWIPCEVNGNWSSWSIWGPCSVTCSLGVKVRTRNCSDPVPSYGGQPCPGEDFENETCFQPSCPTDGSWSPWGYWGECTATCAGGVKTRARTCTNPQPLHGGTECVGNDKANITCNLLECREAFVNDEEEETTEADGAVTIGIIGLVLCCSILGAVVVLDIATIHRHLAFMKRNIDDFLYRRGWKKKLKAGSHRSRRKSSRRRRTDDPPADPSQVEIRLDNGDRPRSSMPPNNTITAQLDVDGLRGQGPSRFGDRHNLSENNLNTLDLKNFDSRYHKALKGYSNLEFSQTQL